MGQLRDIKPGVYSNRGNVPKYGADLFCYTNANHSDIYLFIYLEGKLLVQFYIIYSFTIKYAGYKSSSAAGLLSSTGSFSTLIILSDRSKKMQSSARAAN